MLIGFGTNGSASCRALDNAGRFGQSGGCFGDYCSNPTFFALEAEARELLAEFLRLYTV